MGKSLNEKLRQLNDASKLSEKSKAKMKNAISSEIQMRQKRRRKFSPKVIGIIVTMFVLGLTYTLLNDKIDLTSPGNSDYTKEIVDHHTPEKLPTVVPEEDSFTIEWLSDSMDRGEHDLETNVHGRLVVFPILNPMDRGDILYYEMDGERQIGRIVGLPGETVEIRNGQVYIDDKKLNTFYGVATNRGMEKEEYFEKMDERNMNRQSMEEYFDTSLAPVYVEEDTLFVLVDAWWRGSDSRTYGPIQIEHIQGKVVGYEADSREVVQDGLPNNIPSFVQEIDMQKIDWERKAVRFGDRGILLGNENKSGIIGADEPNLNATRKWMWHLWGIEQADLTVVGYHRETKTVHQIITDGWTKEVAGKVNGADAHVPSNVQIPMAGEWAMLLYTDGELFDILVLDINK